MSKVHEFCTLEQGIWTFQFEIHFTIFTVEVDETRPCLYYSGPLFKILILPCFITLDSGVGTGDVFCTVIFGALKGSRPSHLV